MSNSSAQVLLAPNASVAWERAVRPWLESGRGTLSHRLVVVPTRGQALGWKQLCVRRGLPLLGVEFLTPGLARRKWLSQATGSRPVLGKEFLLLGLRGLVAERLEAAEARVAAGAPPAPAESVAIWRSLRSDPERALQALDDLLQAGFSVADFPHRELAELGADLRAWVEGLGHGFGPAQAQVAAGDPLPADTAPLAEDVLVVGLGPENAGEFFNVAALVRRCSRATVVLPAPALRGAAEADAEERPDEAWVTRWETFLGATAELLNGSEAEMDGEDAAAEASSSEGPDNDSAAAARRGEIECLFGTDRMAEAELIVGRVCAWLREDAGARRAGDAGLRGERGDIAVVFPGPGALHRLVSGRLRELGVPHHDQVGRAAAPPVDTQVLRGVVDFWARGARLDEVFGLHERLRAMNLAELEAEEAAFRAHVEDRFLETCDHALASAVPEQDGQAASAARGRERPRSGENKGEAGATGDSGDAAGAGDADRARVDAEDGRSGRDAGREDLRRMAAVLLPAWPARVTLAEAASRLRAVAEAWGLALPEGFETLPAFAAREPRSWPRELVADLVLAFLPETVDAPEPAGKARGFAPLVLTTRRRAEGLPWARMILAQANAGEWPRRREPNPWLDDGARRSLNRGGRGLAALVTSEEASGLERAGYDRLAGDAAVALAVSAAARDEADPDRELAPNGFLERLLWRRGERRPRAALARAAVPARGRTGPGPAEGAAPMDPRWLETRLGRRDPTRPFDACFLCIDLVDTDEAPLPERLSPSTLEKGVADPAVLWFRGLLGLEAARRGPLERAMSLRRGQTAHRLLAEAVRPEGCRQGEWGAMREEADARARLERGLAAERARRPAGQWYWEAEHGRLEALCRALLTRFYANGEGDQVVVEAWLPEAAKLTLPGWTIPLHGRIDVARADRPGWAGARVHLYDYKSGVAEKALDAARMAAKAESLQLALYLDAVRSLGAAEARIWKLTADEATSLGLGELDAALADLPRLLRAMRVGRYGALTPDRNPYGGKLPWVWPLACAPIAERDLRAKYALTFPEDSGDAGDDGHAGDEAGTDGPAAAEAGAVVAARAARTAREDGEANS